VLTEADTCTRYVLTKLKGAGYDADPHSFRKQLTFTDGQIVLARNKTRRKPKKRAD
jgi:type I restriction enzyme, R subunit